MNTLNTIITLKCDNCGYSYEITEDKKRRRLKNGTHNYCAQCMKKYADDKRKNYFNSLSDKEKKEFIQKRNWYAKASEEKQKEHAQKTRNAITQRSIEEQAKINKKNSEGLKKHWSTVSDDDKQKRLKGMRDGNSRYWESLSQEERVEKAKQWMYNMTDEELKNHLQILSQRMSEYNKSLSEEEKMRRVEIMQEWHKQLSDEEKQQFYERTHGWYYKLSDEQKEEYANSKREWYDNLSDEEKIKWSKNGSEWYNNLSEEEKSTFIKKTNWYSFLSEEDKQKISEERKERWNNLSEEEKEIISKNAKLRWDNLTFEEKRQYSKKQQEYWNSLSEEEKINITKKKLSSPNIRNNLNKRFEDLFMNSIIINDYYFISETIMSGDTIHSWDYGIYNKLNNELVMLVDLDGEYFHVDNCDYDGLHSKEEYDEKRSMSIPLNNNIRTFIIQERNLKRSFELMMKLLMMESYDEYLIYLFNMCRSMPFPTPKFEYKFLIKSYNQLCNMKCDDKYHKSLSLNTRIGDNIIQHFHESIWMAKVRNKPSPYEAWYDDDMLMKCIKNRVIYQSYLNPNKILQGFNVSKIAPKVSVFSAGRAKMLIHRYLSDCNEIFDPFSGFSGRMLGAVSLGKKYIGQDISSIHVRESNEMISFLKKYEIDIDATVIQQDILKSTGAYQALFTCSPYSDKEQWQDIKPHKRTCDDWIDECLSRFNCRKYLFVVDYTEKYKDYIVDEIHNKSHLNKNSEYVILIQR